MRILAIGLGGAGSRIVDELYGQDVRGGIGCMSALAVDFDVQTLLSLKYLPRSARIHFPPIDPTSPYDIRTTIDIEEVMTRIQQVDTIEIDSIMIFCGLGGSLVDAAPMVIRELRKSFIEPIYAVVTLPCTGEGKKRSAKAADDLDMLQPIVDAVLLFDNDTWYRKLKAEMTVATEVVERIEQTKNIARRFAHRPSASTKELVYAQLNDRISRSVGLLLRAGEFNEKGVENAEVVLDAGEVLNTLTGMGLVAIGYAADNLPRGAFSVLDRWRSSSYFIEESQHKASRIVALAKRAVYDDISIPCDLTSAEKALVLIAGPSGELSMRGFQTVRKWIDRSIAGLEMRSGDYPVRNTRYVGIIILLSGMKNIPRLEEIRQIREEYRNDLQREAPPAEQELPAPGESMDLLAPPVAAAGAGAGSGSGEPALESLRDQQIAMPGAKPAKASRSIPLFEGLTVSYKKVKYGKEDQAKGSDPSHISKMTTVKEPQAPRDAVFGLKDVQFDRAPRDAGGGKPLSAGSGIPAPRDAALGPSGVQFKPMTRADDSSFTNRDIRVRADQARPTDAGMLSPGRGLAAKPAQPKELDPGRGSLTVIDPRGKPEQKKRKVRLASEEAAAPADAGKAAGNGNADDNSEGISWIR